MLDLRGALRTAFLGPPSVVGHWPTARILNGRNAIGDSFLILSSNCHIPLVLGVLW